MPHYVPKAVSLKWLCEPLESMTVHICLASNWAIVKTILIGKNLIQIICVDNGADTNTNNFTYLAFIEFQTKWSKANLLSCNNFCWFMKESFKSQPF